MNDELERLEAVREMESMGKGALIGIYLGSLLAILFTCIPAIYAELTPQPAWIKAHWATYLWLASVGLALCILIGIVGRFAGLGAQIGKAIGLLICASLAGLFFGWFGFACVLLGCCGALEHHCCPEHQEEPKVRYRPSYERQGTSLRTAGRWVLRVVTLATAIYVWSLLDGWYQHDADTCWPPKEIQANNPA